MSPVVPALISTILGLGALPGPANVASSSPVPATAVPHRAERTAGALVGRIVVLDPGHQLGNRNFPARIAQPVPAGGFTKPCNTTGTATAGGYPESTFAWRVAIGVRRRLERLAPRSC